MRNSTENYTMTIKIFAFTAILIGEVAVMLVEILGARFYGIDHQSFWGTFLRLVVPVTVGAWLLLVGYMTGLIAFQNVWVLSAVSVASILIFEPILAYFLTGQLPTTGAGIGFALGITGLLITLFW